MATTKKGLGRGLSALIPDEDMEFLSRMARGDASLTVSLSDSNNQKLATLPLQDFLRVHASVAVDTAEQQSSEPPSESQNNPVWVAHTAIEANFYQPRRVFSQEEMSDLVASVKEHGIIQPILVRP